MGPVLNFVPVLGWREGLSELYDFQGVGSAPYLTSVVHPSSEFGVTSPIDKAEKISREGTLIKVFFMEAVVEDRNQIGDML